MKNNLVVILGAGFSRPIGLPLANDIRERFDRDQRKKLLLFGSSEWMWEDGKSDVDKNNGSMYPDSTVYSYILNEAVKQYKSEKGSFENYELFYQWIQDVSLNHDVKNEVYEKAKSELLKDYPFIGNFRPEYDGDTSPYLYRLDNDSDLSRLSSIVNYLIADLLGFTDAQFNSNLHEYECFFQYIKDFDEVDIFTLNHDLLLENLFKSFGLEYSRGFTKESSEIHYQDEGTPLAVFKDAFEKPIRIHKLHGSLDFYRFEHYIQGTKPYLEPTGKYNYFTTTNYREKHFAIRVNPETGETLQDQNFDVVPKFITGTDKTEIIKNDIMYTDIFNRFENCLTEVNNILISGYSFGDMHINKELQKRTNFEVTNQNPGKKYPYLASGISNIKFLSDLK